MMNSYLLYFEEYVYVVIKNEKVLIYNTLNGQKIECNNIKILNLLHGIEWTKNKYSKRITSKDLQENEVLNFINKIRNYYLGDIIEAKTKISSPFQLPLNIRIQNNIESFKELKDNSIGRKLFMNLREVTIYLNNACTLNCKICKTCYTQMVFCTKYQDSNNELSINLLELIFRELQKGRLCRINLVGGDILLFPNLLQLNKMLSPYIEICEYYIFYKNILLNNDLHKINSKIILNVLFDNSTNESNVNEVYEIMLKLNFKFRFTFIMQEESDFYITDINLLKNDKVDFNIRPYFNNSNYKFFKRNVFIKKNDLFINKPTMKQIAINKILNQNDFGKITILSNGNIHANLNNNSIGNIMKNTIEDTITIEMFSKNSWFKTREHLNPCKNCIYCLLCPPVSNYEYIFRKYNLCTIRGKRIDD